MAVLGRPVSFKTQALNHDQLTETGQPGEDLGGRFEFMPLIPFLVSGIVKFEDFDEC